MRIAQVINAMGRGGAEIQAKDYAVRLAKRGHDVLLVSLIDFEDFEDELRSSGVQTATLHMQKGRKSVMALPQLVGLLAKFRPDVIHAHMFAGIIAARAARACLTPLMLAGAKMPLVIGTAHTPFERKPRRYLAYRATNAFSDLWTCVCQEGVETHERNHAVPSGTGVRTVNGIDTSLYSPDAELRATKRKELGIGDDTFVWFTAGSFRNEQKDYSNLLQAFVDVIAKAPDTRLLIAGAGELLATKKAEAERLGVGKQVSFLGLRADMRELCSHMDNDCLYFAWQNQRD